MQRQESQLMVYKDGDETFQGRSIKIILPPKPGCEGDNWDESCSRNDMVESRMDVCALTLSCLAQDPNLPSSKLPFAWKLYEMLEFVHRNKTDTDIVSWVDDGHAFKIHDVNRFVEEVVPTYFKQSKYKSFQRQLYFYGFTRVAASGKEGQTPGSYRHPLFIRGKKTLCLSMAPKKTKKRGGKSAATGPPPTLPDVARKVSSELDLADSSSPSGNGMPALPLHQAAQDNKTTYDSDANVAAPPLDRASSSTKTIPTANGIARHRNDPDSNFQQQQNQLQKLQMATFLQSLQQGERKNFSVPNQRSALPAPQLRPQESDGLQCNIFGGNFHVVGRNGSQKR